MVLVPEHTLERLQQREKIQTAPLTSRLSSLDHEMEDVLNSKELNNEEKARRYSQALQNYLTYYNQRKEKPLKIKFEAVEPSLQKGPQEEGIQSEVKDDRLERDIINALPKTLKNRGKMLIEKIRENPNIMKWDERGQLIFEDKPLQGSHIVDLIGDFMRERKGVDPIGWQAFARGLARMNAPEDLVRNERRRGALREFKSRIDDQENPSVWLPTPPPSEPPNKPTSKRHLYQGLPPTPLSGETPGTLKTRKPRWLQYRS